MKEIGESFDDVINKVLDGYKNEEELRVFAKEWFFHGVNSGPANFDETYSEIKRGKVEG